MPRISQQYIEAKRMSYFVSNLWNALTLIENREEAIIFFEELFTPTEIRMMAKRIQIAKMLLEGYKYEDIRNYIRVTDSTISSVNNQLQYRNGGYIKIIERLIKIEQRQQEKLEGKRGLLDPGPYSGRKTTDWMVSKIAAKGQNLIKRKSIEKSYDPK